MIIIGGLVLISAIVLVFSLFRNEAPITKGRQQHHVEYKEGITLDIYFPTDNMSDKSPVLVYVHGGAWIGGSKAAINFNRINGAINELRENGYTVVCPDYTLAGNGKSPFPDCIHDIYDALEWVKLNAPKHNFDLDRVGMLGESAGGHITMLTVFADPDVFGMEPLPLEIDYVIDIYGPTDLEGIYHSKTVSDLMRTISDWPENLRSSVDISRRIFGFNPLEDTLRARQFMTTYSPLSYVRANNPPTLIIQGNKDRLVPYGQSQALAAMLDSVGVENEFHLLDGVDHAFAGASQTQKDSIQKWIVDFVLEVGD